MNNCNNCGAPLDDDALFCANCGKKIAPQGKTCPKCGAKVEEESVFCTKCGSKLDTQAVPPINSTQVVNSVTPAQEEVFYELEEKTSKKWRYIICGIFVVILAFGWCSYKIIHKSKNLDIIELTSDEESIFVELVNKWSELHNNKGFDDRENCPYAEIIYYYGTKMVGIDAAQEKQKALTAKSDYSQECTNIKVTKITEKLFVCNFEKHTHSNGKDKVHHDCYLYFSDEGEGVWKIKEESDSETDKTLLNKRIGNSYDEVTLPITLQFIRDYCDYLKLPYNYWSYVENEILEKKLNVSAYYEPIMSSDPYELRGDIAMKYKYNNENTYLRLLSPSNYLRFCDAIGRIKDVWNVVPVKIEGGYQEGLQSFQFKYEGHGFENVIIRANYIEDGVEEMDDIPIYHYEYVDDKNKEVKLDLLSD